jgi:phenylacetate-CoA ligase
MFIAEDCNPKKMFEEHTSGTTGKPLTLWWSHQTVLNWYALFEARVRVWHDVSRFDRWGIIGGQLVTPVSANKPPFWVWNYGLNQLYLSAYHIKSSTVKDYIDAIKKYRIQYLFGYASALEALAMLILEQNIDVPFKLKVVITNAEPLYQHQRQLISSAFGCAVRSTYGMSEIVTTASECSCGTMHLWPEVGIVETIQSDSTKEPAFGECGRLVCTGLFNQDMPLIRYDTGDLGAVSLDKRACGCGRSLPWLKKIEGRSDDVIITPDGRRVGRLDPVFKANFPIREAQVIQESLSCIRILYVPSGGFKKQDEMAIIKSVQNRVGDMEILMEAVNDIPRGSNGKFRAVISKLKRDSAESEMR